MHRLNFCVVLPKLERAHFNSVHNFTVQDLIRFLNNCPNLKELVLNRVMVDMNHLKTLKCSISTTNMHHVLNDLNAMKHLTDLSIVIENPNNLFFFESCKLLRRILTLLDELPHLKTFEFGQLNIHDFDTSFVTNFMSMKSNAKVKLQCGHDIYSIEQGVIFKNRLKIADKWNIAYNMDMESSLVEVLPRCIRITNIRELKSMGKSYVENVKRLIIHLDYKQMSRVVVDLFKLTEKIFGSVIEDLQLCGISMGK